jgi:uncharacterized protein
MKEIFPGCRRLPLLDNSPTALLHRWLVTLLLSFLFVGKALSQAEEDIPDHKGIWVHDNAGVLSQQTKQYLEQFLQHDRDSTSNQIAVLILKSLNGQDIDDYAFRVFEKWDLGQKGKNNGVLYLIAIDDRKARIEVGEGLEGVLTDLQSSRINRDRVAPYFRQGNFDQGVVAGVKAIRETIRGEYVNENPKQFRKKKRGSSIYTVLIIMEEEVGAAAEAIGRAAEVGSYQVVDLDPVRVRGDRVPTLAVEVSLGVEAQVIHGS